MNYKTYILYIEMSDIKKIIFKLNDDYDNTGHLDKTLFFNIMSNDNVDILRKDIIYNAIINKLYDVVNTMIYPDIISDDYYNVKSRLSTITFYSKEYNSFRKFTNLTTTYTLVYPFILDNNNINHLIDRIINTIVNKHNKVYMITIYDEINNVYINKSLHMLASSLCQYLEMYDNNINITDIIVRETIPDLHPPKHMYVNKGEGIHQYMGDGYWLCDVSQSKKLCLINVLLTWNCYSKLLKIPNSDEMKILRRRYCNNNVIPSNISTSYISNIIGYDKFIIVTNISNIKPEDTINNLVCYVDCNHATLVIHEKYLTQDYIKWLNYRSRCTFVNIIRKIHNIKDDSKQLIVADIECYRDKTLLPIINHIPVISCYYDGNSYKQFKGKECVRDMLLSLSTLDNPVIWLHNSGGYDSHLILKEAIYICNNKLFNPIEICDIDGYIVKMVIHLNNNTITISDSYKLLSRSLDSLSNDLLSKHKINYDIINSTYDDLLSDKCLKYNRYDCYLLYNILVKVNKILTDNKWPTPITSSTLSSYAKKMFYYKYYNYDDHPIYVTPRWLHEIIKKSYKGGRCEVFKRGIIYGQLYCYDVNSMYPYAGCNKLPYGKPIYKQNINTIVTLDFINNNYGFYDITIISSDINCRPLHGCYVDNKFMFSKFYNTRCILFSEEVKVGLGLGYKYIIHNVISYNSYNYMSDMFHDIYNKKLLSKDLSERLIWKMISNSCYGFMGFKKYNRTILNTYGCLDGDEVISSHINGFCDFVQLDNNMYLVSENKHILLSDTNISIASAISSYARVYLHKIITDVEKLGIDVLYCDTDSIFTNKQIDIYIGDEIGKLKREYINDDIIEACVCNSKCYGFRTSHNNYIVKIKGVINNKIVTDDGNITKSNISNILYDKLREGLLTDDIIKITMSKIYKDRHSKINKDLYLYENIREHIISLKYNKGIVACDGNVKCYRINNGNIF